MCMLHPHHRTNSWRFLSWKWSGAAMSWMQDTQLTALHVARALDALSPPSVWAVRAFDSHSGPHNAQLPAAITHFSLGLVLHHPHFAAARLTTNFVLLARLLWRLSGASDTWHLYCELLQYRHIGGCVGWSEIQHCVYKTLWLWSVQSLLLHNPFL